MRISRRPRTEPGARSRHVSTLSLAVSAVAVVLASTGTAVAVTATTVQLADPKNAAQIARVDGKGRLTTLEPATTISTGGLLSGYQNADNFVTSPTTATLAITKIQVAQSGVNEGVAGSAVRVVVYKTGVDAAGNCASTGYVQLAFYQLDGGDTTIDPWPSPLTVAPTGTAKYCIDFYVYQLGSGGALSYYPSYDLGAYVVSGTYTGIGTGTTPAAAPQKAPVGSDAK